LVFFRSGLFSFRLGIVGLLPGAKSVVAKLRSSVAIPSSCWISCCCVETTPEDHEWPWEGPPEDQKDHQQSYSLLLINYDSYLMPTQIKFTIIYKNIALEKLSSIFSSNKKIKLNWFLSQYLRKKIDLSKYSNFYIKMLSIEKFLVFWLYLVKATDKPNVGKCRREC
jgi:hypothetical protein